VKCAVAAVLQVSSAWCMRMIVGGAICVRAEFKVPGLLGRSLHENRASHTAVMSIPRSPYAVFA